MKYVDKEPQNGQDRGNKEKNFAVLGFSRGFMYNFQLEEE